MQLASSAPVFPFSLAANYIQQWTCDIQNKTSDNLYYKCLGGEGLVSFSSQFKYRGKVQNGLFQGTGTFYWPNGVIYEGLFMGSKISGQGKFVWPDGSFYEGQVQDGKREGQGTYYCFPEKYIYAGQWKQGLKQGKGKIQYKDQSIYEGDFHLDRRHGFGKMIYSSKNEYEGMWSNDKKEGKGTMNWLNAHEKYTGQWKEDLPNGYGEYYWYENKTQFKTFKNTYKGQWKQGKRSGFGSFYFSNGYKFEGFYRQNLKEGLGLITDENGVPKLQQYCGDRPVELKLGNRRKLEVRQNREVDSSSKKFPLMASKNHSKQDSSVSNSKLTEAGSNFIWQNDYQKCIDFEHNEVNENFFNMLLRYNSKLRNLYKCIGVSNSQLKDFYSGMVLENYWKALRQCKLLSQNYSLAGLDRQFSKGSKFYFDARLPDRTILETLNKERYDEKALNYCQILWYDYFQKLSKKSQLDWQKMSLNIKTNSLIPPIATAVDIHQPSNIILYRHFICLIIHTALLIDDSRKPLKEKVQFVINNLEHINDPNFKQRCQDSYTQAGSGKAIIVPEWVKSIHEELVQEVETRVQNYDGRSDFTVPVRKLYALLERGNIFKDVNQKILYLQRIERYLNIKTSPLKKQHRNIYTQIEKCIKWNQNFGYLMNYEMNMKEIHEFLFLCINKKFVAENQEEFQIKYKQIVKTLVSEARQIKNNTISKCLLKCKKKPSEKDRMKEELIERTQKDKLKVIEEEKRKKQQEKERREREQMHDEDHDAEENTLENEDSDDYYG